MLGVLFGLLSAASFGLTGATIRRGVMGASALQGLYVTIFTALPMFALVTLLVGDIAKWDAFGGRDYVFLGLGGIAQLLIGHCLRLRLERVDFGYARIQALEVALVLGADDLGEELTDHGL